jgi:hypothetical protein
MGNRRRIGGSLLSGREDQQHPDQLHDLTEDPRAKLKDPKPKVGSEAEK